MKIYRKPFCSKFFRVGSVAKWMKMKRKIVKHETSWKRFRQQKNMTNRPPTLFKCSWTPAATRHCKWLHCVLLKAFPVIIFCFATSSRALKRKQPSGKWEESVLLRAAAANIIPAGDWLQRDSNTKRKNSIAELLRIIDPEAQAGEISTAWNPHHNNHRWVQETKGLLMIRTRLGFIPANNALLSAIVARRKNSSSANSRIVQHFRLLPACISEIKQEKNRKLSNSQDEVRN